MIQRCVDLGLEDYPEESDLDNLIEGREHVIGELRRLKSFGVSENGEDDWDTDLEDEYDDLIWRLEWTIKSLKDAKLKSNPEKPHFETTRKQVDYNKNGKPEFYFVELYGSGYPVNYEKVTEKTYAESKIPLRKSAVIFERNKEWEDSYIERLLDRKAFRDPIFGKVDGIRVDFNTFLNQMKKDGVTPTFRDKVRFLRGHK